MLVVLEVIEAVYLFSADRDVFKSQVKDSRIRRAPKYIRLSQNTRRSHPDILKEDAGKIARSPLALTWIRIGLKTLHRDHEMLQRRSWILDSNVTKDNAFTTWTRSLTSHIENSPATPLIPTGPSIDDVAIFHNDLPVGHRAEDKRRPIIVVPIGDSAYTSSIHIGGVILSA